MTHRVENVIRNIDLRESSWLYDQLWEVALNLTSKRRPSREIKKWISKKMGQTIT